MTTTRTPAAPERPAPPAPDSGWGGALRRLGADLAYLLPGLPLAVVSFSCLVVLFAASVGLLVVWVGVPLLVVTLYTARGFAAAERRRIQARGEEARTPGYGNTPEEASFVTSRLALLRQRQYWLDLVHGIVSFPLALATWTITVVWLAMAVGGLTFWFWDGYLPQDGQSGLADLLDLDVPEWAVMLVVGVLAATTLMPVTRALADGQTWVSKTLLCPNRAEELRHRVDHLTHSRAAAAEAEVASMRRLERDIHDGPQQRLVRLGMDLASAERRMSDDPEAAQRLLGEAREQTAAALDELRGLSRGIAPPILVDRGLISAVRELALAGAVPTDVETDLPEGVRLSGRVETAAYFTVAETLANVAKHARATRARVEIRLSDEDAPGALRIHVTDDGVGGASFAKGQGLTGLRDRLGAVDGTLTLDSPENGPTVVRAEIPCAS